MHYSVIVALDGDIKPEDLRNALDEAMEVFSEHREVEWHRDTSVYAEPFAVQLAKAKAYAEESGGDPRSDAELVKDWAGHTRFDTDGWPLTTSNPDGNWDWFVVGGRWGGAWVLKPGATDGPLATEDSSFGPSDEANAPRRTDNARWADLEPESVEPGYAYLDLDGTWHTRWIGPTREEALSDTFPSDTSHWTMPAEQHTERFMKFLAALPGETWLVQVDIHS